jgi:hypothetical protein
VNFAGTDLNVRKNLMRIKNKLLPHAKLRLIERYGMEKLPEGKRD